MSFDLSSFIFVYFIVYIQKFKIDDAMLELNSTFFAFSYN